MEPKEKKTSKSGTSKEDKGPPRVQLMANLNTLLRRFYSLDFKNIVDLELRMQWCEDMRDMIEEQRTFNKDVDPVQMDLLMEEITRRTDAIIAEIGKEDVTTAVDDTLPPLEPLGDESSGRDPKLEPTQQRLQLRPFFILFNSNHLI